MTALALLAVLAATAPAHHLRGEVSAAPLVLRDGTRVVRLGIVGLMTDGMDRAVAEVVAAAGRSGVGLLEVTIDSPGGKAAVGASIFGTLSAADVLVRCLVTGSASSMAFVVLQACDDRAALPKARLVTHRPYDVFLPDRRPFHSEDLRALAEELDVSQVFMVQAMVDRGGLPSAVYNERLSRGDWRMAPDEAIMQGFLDRVVGSQAEFTKSVESTARKDK